MYSLTGTPTYCSAEKGVAIKLFAQEAAHESKSPLTGRLFGGESYCLHTEQQLWCSFHSAISGGRIVDTH